jgi:protein disulfide-isomerase/protein disulfide-isomerase A1
MVYLKYALALLPAALGSASKVVVLTTANFDEHIETSSEGTLVEFYAPWCGHCKRLEPEFDAASETMAEAGIKQTLAKVDATVENELASRFGVRGFPTMKWFVNGQANEYDGPRERKGIVDWIKSMTGPTVVEETPDLDAAKGLVMTLYGPELYDAYQGLAKANRKGAAWHYVKQDGEAKLSSKHPKEAAIEQTVTAETSQADLAKMFKDNQYPFFGALNQDSFSQYIERGNGLVWALFEMTASTVDEVVESKREMMTEVAKAVGKDYSIAWTNTVEYVKVLEQMFGLTEFPRLVVQKKAGDKKNFIYDGEMTQEAITKYIEDVREGRVTPHLKSEPAPEEPQTDPVKVIVGSTLEKLCFTEDKDVMLEIYAPWCGHCKKLDPEYIKVGKKVQKEGFEDKLVIAKMDGTANDSPVDSISWSGFPTIYYIKAGDSTPGKYDGERTAKGMWKWIKKNSTYGAEIEEQIKSSKDSKKEEL